MEEDIYLRVRLRFGVFELDPRAGELRKHGLRVRLQEQPFQVLAMLLEHPGEVLTREELQKKLWPADTFVDFDHGLNKAINKIREALSDSADSPRFVETVARRGYRFLAEVKVADSAPVRSPDLATEPDPTAEVRDRPDVSEKLALPNVFCRHLRGRYQRSRCLYSWYPLSPGSFIPGTARPLSFAAWLSFRSKAFRAMRLVASHHGAEQSSAGFTRNPSIPSFAMIGTMTSPATRSTDERPNGRLSDNPPRRMPDR